MPATEIQIDIPEDTTGRLDKVLASLLQKDYALSRSRIKELIQSGRVFQDGVRVTNTSQTALAGGQVRMTIPAPVPSEILPQNIPLEIVHEDDDLLVVSKPKGMVVHPAAGAPDGTLVNALLFHLGDGLSSIGGVERPGIVHRIDKDTSGLLVVAKNDRTHEGLGQQFRAHSIERSYEAYVYGQLEHDNPRLHGLDGVLREPQGLRVDLPIGRHKTDRKRMAIRLDGRHAATNIRVQGYDDNATISRIECRLETGRTHQIRVHMNHIGHPLLGDPLYGKGARQLPKNTDEGLREVVLNLSGQALHAKSLGFVHPVRGTYLSFEAAPPEELQKLKVFVQ